MEASKNRVFYYHADASPLGGHITHPFESVLPTHASSSLSQAGGQVAARLEKVKLDDIVLCESAYSQVAGSIHSTTKNWTTLVTAVVENMNVLEIVTADRVVSRLSIEHPHDGYYPKVSFVGTQYENLRIGGKPVTPVIDLNFLSASTVDQKPQSAAEKEKASANAAPNLVEFPDVPWPDVESFVRRAVDQSERITSAKGVPAWLKARYDWMESPAARKQKGYVVCSLVQDVQGTVPGSTFGHVVQVPDFGNIFLGELIVGPHSFQLTMIRAEMGCATEGNLSFASSRGNGSPMP